MKKPSFVRKVRYADIVRELYEAFVSLQSEEDKGMKKQIANCIIGLLDKHLNKKHKSYIFETYQRPSSTKRDTAGRSTT